MAVINTARNVVCAYEPQPDDIFCYVGWQSPGGNARLPMRHIDDHGEAVEWALGFADYIEQPIHVVPLNYLDVIRTKRVLPFLDFAERITMQTCRADWEAAIALCFDVVALSPESVIRAKAEAILKRWGASLS